MTSLISYQRAKADALGMGGAKGGLMERAERMILLGVGFLSPGLLVPVLWVLLGLTSATAVGRFVRVWRAAEGPTRGSSPSGPARSRWREGRVDSRWRSWREARPRASRGLASAGSRRAAGAPGAARPRSASRSGRLRRARGGASGRVARRATRTS